MRVQMLRGRNVYRLCERINVRVSGVLYSVPKGFEWDGASIPNFLFSVIFVTPYHHTVRRAGLVHDYLYRRANDRKLADYVFLCIMKQDGANWVQRTAMYLAVRCFGWLFHKGR